jgi:starch synthase
MNFDYGSSRIRRLRNSTSGLADTITDASPAALAAGTATGFTFSDYSALALAEALSRACQAYRQPEVWRQLVQTGMRQDWSWATSARGYVELYRATINRLRRGLVADKA